MIRVPDIMRPLAAVATETYQRVRATRRAERASTRSPNAVPPQRRTADPNAWLGVYVDAYA